MRSLFFLAITGVSCSAAALSQSRHPPAHPGNTAGQVSTAAKLVPPSSPTERLQALLKAQAAAVQSGDPRSAADASRSLNAETLALLATLRLGEGKFDEGSRLFELAIEQHDNPSLRLEFASLLLRSGHPAQAADEAQKVTIADPANAVGWTTLGGALRATNRGKEAVDALSHSLQLQSDISVAYALACALLSTHDKPQADSVFRRILLASGDSAIWHVAIGDAYRDADYLPDAVTEFKAALSRDPRVLHGEFFLGYTYLQQHQWGPSSESFIHLRKAVEQSPHEYISNFYLGALESTDGSDIASSDRHLHGAALADPTQPEVWIYLGQNANREKNYADAKVYLRKAIAASGKDEGRNNYQIRRAYFTLGRLLIADGDRVEGEKYLADYKRTQLASVAEASAAINGTQAEAHSADAAGSASLGAIKPAAATVPVTDAAPESTVPETEPLLRAESQLRQILAESFNDLGTAEARQQQYANALRNFQQAREWGNTTPTLLRNIGVAAYRLQDAKQTNQALTEYFTTAPTPNDPRARIMLAMSQFDIGHFRDASQNFAAAGNLTTQDPRTAYSYAFSLAHDGHAQEANALADRLSSQQLSAETLLLVCHLYFEAENYKGSEGCYRKITAQDPQARTAHYFVGESLIREDRPGEAAPELRAELALSPGEPNVESALAFTLLQTSHKDEARTLLEQTAAAHPDHAETQYELGKLLLEDGKPAEAVPHLEASEKTDASKDYVHYQLATAYRKAGRPGDAEREFKLYRELKDQHRNDQAVPQQR